MRRSSFFFFRISEKKAGRMARFRGAEIHVFPYPTCPISSSWVGVGFVAAPKSIIFAPIAALVLFGVQRGVDSGPKSMVFSDPRMWRCPGPPQKDPPPVGGRSGIRFLFTGPGILKCSRLYQVASSSGGGGPISSGVSLEREGRGPTAHTPRFRPREGYPKDATAGR